MRQASGVRKRALSASVDRNAARPSLYLYRNSAAAHFSANFFAAY